MSFQGHSYLFLKGCGEVAEDWKKTNVTPVFKKEGFRKYRLVSINVIPGKALEEILKVILRTR